MESRFGIKDFFLFSLLVVLIAVVVLAMMQYDRQWQTMQQIDRRMTEQTTDLARIDRMLAQGVPAVATTSPTTGPAMDPDAGFARVLKAQAMPDYAQGGQLTMMSQATPTKLTPLIASDQFTFDFWNYVMDGLVGRDPDTLNYVPNLATSWKVSDDSLTIDFQLRRGVTFSDGSPLTADDVVYTFNLMIDPQIEDPIMKVGADRLDHVEKLNDYAVRFVFKTPYYGSFDLAGGTPIMSKAFYSKYSATDFNRSTGLVLGSGPYRLADPTSWRPEPGQPIVLTRNERYWGPTPSFDHIVWNIIEQPSARVTAFRNGDLDFLGGQDGPPTPEQFTQMCADPAMLAKTRHYNLTTPIEGWYYLGWNEKVGRGGKPTAFADPRVRRAMTMLTDRQTMLQTIIHGYGAPITGPFPPVTPQNDASIVPLPFDPDGAIALLNQAGFHKQGDQLVGPDGTPLSFKMMFNSNSEPRRRMASFLHDAYAKAGIDAEPESVEWSIFEKRMNDRQFDVVIGAWAGSLEGDPYEMFDSSQQDATGENFIQFSSPPLDAAMEKARSTVDDLKRRPLWHEVDRIIHDQQPYTFLFISQELSFVHERIHNTQPTKAMGLNGPGEWFIPKSLQTAQ